MLGTWGNSPRRAAARSESDGVARAAWMVLLGVALVASWKSVRVDSLEPVPEGVATASEAEVGVLGAEPGTGSQPLSPEPAEGSEPAEPAGAAGGESKTVEPLCYEGVALPPGWQAVNRCFHSPDPANDIVRQLREVNLHATTEKTADGRYAVRYQPISEAEAEAAGKSALAGRMPHSKDIYQLEVLAADFVDSYAWKISMPCPPGWRDAGSFKLTAYVLAQERDFPATPTIDDPCGLDGTYPRKFLFGQGVRMQGSGITNKGQVVHFKGKNCFEELDCARTRIGRCAKTGRTIAVDPKLISLGSEVLVEDIGYRIAEDTGGAILGSHIDIYYGTALRLRQAWAHTREDRKVCVKPRAMAF